MFASRDLSACAVFPARTCIGLRGFRDLGSRDLGLGLRGFRDLGI